MVLVQLDDATRQLQDLQEEADQLAKVGCRQITLLSLLICPSAPVLHFRATPDWFSKYHQIRLLQVCVAMV